MEKILEFIMLYYTWILGGSIIILLAVIGYYADKTNFGQGKEKKQQDNGDTQIESQQQIERINNTINKAVIEEQQKNNLKSDNNLEIPMIEQQNDNLNNPKIEENINKEDQSTFNQKEETNVTITDNLEQQNDRNDDFDDVFKVFDQEINELLPEKDIVDEELLDEIDNLSLDKTQKIDVIDISNLDDIELPDIKSITKEQNIWKF